MSVPNELALGFSLGVVGIVVLLAPVLIRVIDPVAADASMKMGEGLAHDSVEHRRQRRLPLRKRFSVLPDRGLVGGAIVLLLLLPVFVMVTRHELARGIYVRLVPRPRSGPDEVCLLGPVVVTVRQHGSAAQLFLGSRKVRPERLEEALKSELTRRANWEVFVEGDDSVSFADTIFAIDAIDALHAKAVILTPRLKEEMAKACPSR